MLIGARITMFSESGMQTTILQAYAFYKNNYGYANVGSPNGLSALSFGGWFKLLEPASNGNYMVCGWSQNGNWGSTYISMWGFRFGTGSSSTAFAMQGGSLPVNKWVHCVASYDGQKCRFFRNGVLDSEYDTGQITLFNNDSQFRIASFDEGSVKYSSIGACQTFVLRRGIATEAEVKKLMRSDGVQILEDDSALIEAWKMDSLDSQSFVGIKNLQRLYISSRTQEIHGPVVEIS